MTPFLQRIVYFCLLSSATANLQWGGNPEDGDVIYFCEGDDVTIPWTFNPTTDKEIISVRWLYGGASQEEIAAYSNGTFYPLPGFSGRVRQQADVGLTLYNLTREDVGNFTVEVHVSIGEMDLLESHQAMLQVADGLQTTDGRLHVIRQPGAIVDTASQEWAIVLSCGHFAYDGQPDFPMEWKTPSGIILPSSNYDSGLFNLHLTGPVEGGYYQCRIPQQYVTSVCLHSNDPARVKVNRVDARMTLMEAEMRVLRRDKQALLQDVQQLRQQLSHANDSSQRLVLQLGGVKDNLTQEVDYVRYLLTQSENRQIRRFTAADDRLREKQVRMDNHITSTSEHAQEVNNELFRVKVRLFRENHQLTQVSEDLTRDVQMLQGSVDGLSAQLISLFSTRTTRLRRRIVRLDRQLTQRVEELEATHRANITSLQLLIQNFPSPRIAFNAQAVQSQQPDRFAHLKFDNVLFNHGDAYNSTTGDFTAPLSGIYVFYFHTRSTNNQGAYSDLKVNGNEVCQTFIESQYEHGSCQAAVHMAAGDRAWVEPYFSLRYYTGHSTSFTGFLLSADPE